MRRIVTLALMLAAGGCFGGSDEIGPAHGRWVLDTGPNEGWYCVHGTTACSAPAYFEPMPEDVTVEGDGVLAWGNGVRHAGTADESCIRIPPATEDGVARTASTFCNLVEGGVVNETRAFVRIGWSPNTADECTCSAHFDLAD